MLFKEIITVYTENHTKPINTKYTVNVKVGGTYSYRWEINGELVQESIDETPK
jgi:hypothetical protein